MKKAEANVTSSFPEPQGVPLPGDPVAVQEAKYLIWSGQRQLWVGDAKAFVYSETWTSDFLRARRFTHREAIDHCRSLNLSWLENGIPSLPVREEDFIATWTALKKAS